MVSISERHVFFPEGVCLWLLVSKLITNLALTNKRAKPNAAQQLYTPYIKNSGYIRLGAPYPLGGSRTNPGGPYLL